MHEMINELHELCEVLEKDLKKTNEKIRKSGGAMTGADLEYVDKLTHSIKSIKSIICMMDDEDGEYSQAGDWGAVGHYDRGNSYANRGEHYVRGHYSRAGRRRDSMGRYSRDGRARYDGGNSYSDGADEMIDYIRDVMKELPQDMQRDAQKFIQKLEEQMG